MRDLLESALVELQAERPGRAFTKEDVAGQLAASGVPRSPATVHTWLQREAADPHGTVARARSGFYRLRSATLPPLLAEDPCWALNATERTVLAAAAHLEEAQLSEDGPGARAWTPAEVLAQVEQDGVRLSQRSVYYAISRLQTTEPAAVRRVRWGWYRLVRRDA